MRTIGRRDHLEEILSDVNRELEAEYGGKVKAVVTGRLVYDDRGMPKIYLPDPDHGRMDINLWVLADIYPYMDDEDMHKMLRNRICSLLGQC